MTKVTSNQCWRFRTALDKAAYEGRVPSKTDGFVDLRKLATKLEHALRSDLGIQGFEQKSSKHHIVEEAENDWIEN